MAVLKSGNIMCIQCNESMTIIAKDRLVFTIDGSEVVRIKETWKCQNDHTRLKMYGDQPKMIIN